jgi:hypothetical protein
MAPEASDPTWPEVRVAFWRNYHSLVRRADPPRRDEAQDPDFWAWEYVDNLCESGDRAAVDRLVDLADNAADGEEIAYLGAGPVEDLVSAHGATMIDAIEEAARRSPNFLGALNGMSVDLIPESIRERLLPLVPATEREIRLRREQGLAPW